jgi:hypothetical protein
LYRSMTGRNMQIKIERDAMSVRYWWPKEVVPGSARKNSSSVWFSLWVRIQRTVPSVICSVRAMEDLLSRTSDTSIFDTVHLVQIDTHVQPLVWGKCSKGRLRPASVDHISNIIQSNMDMVGMGNMKTSHLRGASVSKIVDLAPNLRVQALALGRWTTDMTFRNHYYAPLLVTPAPLPVKYKSNPQQVLRWGWQASPPSGVTISEYEKGPTFWVGKTFSAGKISSFDEGSYIITKLGISQELTHEELMIWVGQSRT